MTFNEQIIATLIGTFFGFLGSLILFWIKISWDTNRAKKNLIKNLEYKLNYNIHFFNQTEQDLTKAIEAINADNKNTYLNLNYSLIARFFAVPFYQVGLISIYIKTEDMKKWNDFMVNLREGAETFANETMKRWRKSEISKQDAFDVFELERNHIIEARQFSANLKDLITKQ